jgi:hypothetical protein
VTNSDICPEDIPTPDTWEINSHPKTGKVLTASYNRRVVLIQLVLEKEEHVHIDKASIN